MSNNWYNTDYKKDTGSEVVFEAREKKKKELSGIKLLAIICAAILLIVVVSIAFAGTGNDYNPAIFGPMPGQGYSSDSLPEDWADFFDSYYEKTQTNMAETNIERTPLPIDFELELVSAEGEERTIQEIYADCSSSIVAISGYFDDTSGYNWGTGMIISSDGLVLTNTHVINSCDSATVTLFDDTKYEAKLVGADAISDIAVLKIDATNLPAAEFGESGALLVGDKVVAIGNPLGEEFRMTLTDGIISAIERGVSVDGQSMTLLQTNTAINEGNSGGPLFNMFGQVVGVTNMKMMSSYSSIEGIGFAIPSSTVQSVVNSIVNYGEVKGRPSIGITVGGIPEDIASHYELPEGLYVSEVAQGSDAQAKGIQPGDIILEVNNIAVTTTAQVSEIKEGLLVGDELRFKIWREGKTLNITVALMDTMDVYG